MRINIVSMPLMLFLLGMIVYIDISVKALKKLKKYKKHGISLTGKVIKKNFDTKAKTAKIHMEYPCDGVYCQGISDDIVSYTIEEAIINFENDKYYDVLVYPDDHKYFIREADIARSRRHCITAIPVCAVVSAVILYIVIVGIKLPVDF